MESALTIITNARNSGALVFSPQNLDCPPLYKPEVSIIKARADEFHNMKGKFMPNRAVTDRISEAVGVDFVAEQCRVNSELREAMPEFSLPRRTVFVGYAQGRVRLPDGSWRYSTVAEYEFDPVLRATQEGTGQKGALEYMRFAHQRASTGARLGVIRQLAGMPVTFTQEEITRPLVFSRIVQNTDYILSTKEGRVMAIANATGMAAQLYGPKAQAPEEAAAFDAVEPRNVTPEEDEAEDPDPFSPEGFNQAESNGAFESAMRAVVEWTESDRLWLQTKNAAQTIVDRGESNIEILKAAAKLLKLQTMKLNESARILTNELLKNPHAAVVDYENMISRTEAFLRQTNQAVPA